MRSTSWSCCRSRSSAWWRTPCPTPSPTSWRDGSWTRRKKRRPTRWRRGSRCTRCAGSSKAGWPGGGAADARSASSRCCWSRPAWWPWRGGNAWIASGARRAPSVAFSSTAAPSMDCSPSGGPWWKRPKPSAPSAGGRKPRHDVASQELHRATPELRLVPVVARHEQRAERPDLLAQRHQLLGDSARTAGDDEGALDGVDGDGVVGHVDVRLQHVERLARLAEAVDEERIVEREPAVRTGEIVFRLLVRLRHQHASRHAPHARIWPAAGRLAALDVLLPLASQIPAVKEVARDRNPATLAGRARAARARVQDRDGDRRMRLLERPRHVADLELRPHRLLQRDLPEAAIEPIGRILRPELQHHVDRLQHHRRAQILVADVEELEVADEPAGADAHDEPAAAQMVEHGRVGGHRGRMRLREVQHAGAEPDVLGAVDDAGEEDQR